MSNKAEQASTRRQLRTKGQVKYSQAQVSTHTQQVQALVVPPVQRTPLNLPQQTSALPFRNQHQRVPSVTRTVPRTQQIRREPYKQRQTRTIHVSNKGRAGVGLEEPL